MGRLKLTMFKLKLEALDAFEAARSLNPILLVMFALMLIFPFVAGRLPAGLQNYLDALYK